MPNQMTPKERAGLSQVGVAAGLGFSIVFTLIVCIAGGLFLDGQFDTEPVLTLVGIALGLILAAYQLYELVQVGNVERPEPPLTRALRRATGRRQTRANTSSNQGESLGSPDRDVRERE